MHSPRLSTRQFGMSLIEILVGVLIGLIGCVVIFQMYATAELRKRTISSGSDMDISGRVALMTLERDVQLAGYGLSNLLSPSYAGLLGCNVAAYDNARPGGTQDIAFPLVPFLIQDGAAGAPDTLIVLRGNSGLTVMPKIIADSDLSFKRLKSDTGGRTGIRPGDVVLAAHTNGGAACAMFEITGDSDPDQLTYEHSTGNYVTAAGTNKTTRYNKGGGIVFDLGGGGGTGLLYNLGTAPIRNLWTVENGRLVFTNELFYTDANADGANDRVPVGDLVINLQAQYGVDANNDGQIAASEWTVTAPTNWTQLLAVRFALLTRSTQLEREKVTTSAPRWSAGAFTMTNVDGTTDSDPGGAGGDANNWRNYRYNVLEAVVPLRNVILGRQLS